MLIESIPPSMTRRLLGAAIVVALTAPAANLSGQQRQPLLDAPNIVKESAYVPSILPDSERAYARIDGAKMKAIVNEIVAISSKSRDDGNKYWGRIAGTKYEAMTADLIEAKFRTARTWWTSTGPSSRCRRNGSRPTGT